MSQEILKKVVNAYLPLLKFIPGWLVTNKMLKDFDNIVFFNGDTIFANEDSDVKFLSDGMGFVNVDLNNVNLGDDNFDNYDPQTIIHVRIMAWCNSYKQRKACKKEISKN